MTDESRLPISRRRVLQLTGLTVGGLALGGASSGVAQESGRTDAATYRVTVANLTDGQPLTPPAVAVHTAETGVFSVGEPASEAVREVAENGNLGPLTTALQDDRFVRGIGFDPSTGPLVPSSDPGDTGFSHTKTLEFGADRSAKFLSFVSMLIGTNDGFTGLDTVALPDAVGESASYYAASFDAGTERNTERFADLVPPAQTLLGVDDDATGTGTSDPSLATDDVVAPHPGIAGDADLDPAIYGWRDPAALVHVERID